MKEMAYISKEYDQNGKFVWTVRDRKGKALVTSGSNKIARMIVTEWGYTVKAITPEVKALFAAKMISAV